MVRILPVVTLMVTSLAASVAVALPPQVMDGKSAYRAPGVSYTAYQQAAATQTPFYLHGQSAQDKAIPYKRGAVLHSTPWASVEAMNQLFNDIRDVRFIEDEDVTGFLRRISWLYPDDGCFARAGLAVENLKSRWNADFPKKVFVFGDLNVQTPNSPSGEVGWWYHVAPIVEVEGKNYVLDPAINPAGPLLLEDWLATMSTDIETLQVAICGSGSYVPFSQCDVESDGVEEGARGDQPYYLSAERNRLMQLGRDANRELGDNPPWKQ